MLSEFDQALLWVALSVFMHVGWNLMARQQPPARGLLWWVLLGHGVLLAPWGLIEWFKTVQWSGHLVGCLLLSASSNAVYFLGLTRAYRQAPVALVYPLVRSSPLLIAVWASLLLDQQLPGHAWFALLVGVAGLLLLTVGIRSTGQQGAVPWALLSMLCTSIYSLSDQQATQHLHSFSALLGYVSFGYACGWLVLSVDLKHRTGRWSPAARPPLWMIAVGGLCIGLAYVLVIHAMRVLPAAVAVAFSNAGIVFATLLSIGVFKERAHSRRRLCAAGLVTLGLFLLRI
ncbi:EamA family transporter [Limnobacter humi]|uniref:EamA family transporter n=1 Tax=Limnobacter humi TaxID=1778671 RepID=A0ABT1WDG6_9BURK|nr:EamA family transporter [Limnobacter humi]MCQ8895563.1 EamA family transporter [Limnobacter humi]